MIIYIYVYFFVSIWTYGTSTQRSTSTSALTSTSRYRVTSLTWPRFFLYLVKSYLSCVRYRTRVHWTSHVSQGSRKTRPCLTGHPVHKGIVTPVAEPLAYLYLIFIIRTTCSCWVEGWVSGLRYTGIRYTVIEYTID